MVAPYARRKVKPGLQARKMQIIKCRNIKDVGNEVRFTLRFLGWPCIWVISRVGQFSHDVVSIIIKLVRKQYDKYLTTLQKLRSAVTQL